ncbi:nitrogenase-stabilizing/protective protein NifW [Paraburkholderia phymatum]|uniref:Nitrogenase-stabilizing/protective protein NifW n=1 Tax=Paraburkholderia phymatum TaxID=148447 RepID=A0ACC6UE55_9BURK
MQFFGIAFDQKVASVGRLHILRRFSVPHHNATTLLTVCQAPRQHAYNNFVVSPPAAENVFKGVPRNRGTPAHLSRQSASIVADVSHRLARRVAMHAHRRLRPAGS